VALDIYRENNQNKGIKERIDGWLTFFSSDRPKDIIALIEKYPDFKEMYEQVYEICRNIEQVIGMFSKELYELDRNTVRYMIDELQEENRRWKEQDRRQKEEIRSQEEEIMRLRKQVEQLNSRKEQTRE
jgi:SMC interacting uncharacterized protein involved in chromosome segregation